MSTKISEVENSCQTISSIFDDYIESKTKSENDISDLKKENNKLKDELKMSNDNFSRLYGDVQELTARSMQENLIFFGLAEAPENDQKEETEVKLRDFLQTEVFPETPEVVDSIIFDRVHRLGGMRPNVRQHPRPIVVKFEKYTDRENVRKAGIDLNKKKCGFSIREQFPIDMEIRRKQLYPVMRRFQENPTNRVVLVRDKLYINGKQYEPSKTEAPYPSSNDRGQNIKNQVQQPFQPFQQDQRRYAFAARQTQPENRNRFEHLAGFSQSTFSPARTDNNRNKQKARSPLEDNIFKRNKTYVTDSNQPNQSDNNIDDQSSGVHETPSDPLAHSNDDALLRQAISNAMNPDSESGSNHDTME